MNTLEGRYLYQKTSGEIYQERAILNVKVVLFSTRGRDMKIVDRLEMNLHWAEVTTNEAYVIKSFIENNHTALAGPQAPFHIEDDVRAVLNMLGGPEVSFANRPRP